MLTRPLPNTIPAPRVFTTTELGHQPILETIPSTTTPSPAAQSAFHPATTSLVPSPARIDVCLWSQGIGDERIQNHDDSLKPEPVDADRLADTIRLAFCFHEQPVTRDLIQAQIRDKPELQGQEAELYRKLFLLNIRQSQFLSWDDQGNSMSGWDFPPHPNDLENPKYLAYRQKVQEQGTPAQKLMMENYAIQLQNTPSLQSSRLLVIATHPDHEKQGLASQRLYPGLDLSDAHDWDSDLKTHGGRFIPWFEKFGYQVTGKFNFVDADYDSFVMVRPARPLIEVTRRWSNSKSTPLHDEVVQILTEEYRRALQAMMVKIKENKRHTPARISFQTIPEHRNLLIDLMASRGWRVWKSEAELDAVTIEVMGSLAAPAP